MIKKIGIPGTSQDVTWDHLHWWNEIFEMLGMGSRLIEDDECDCDLTNFGAALELCEVLSKLEIIEVQIIPDKSIEFYRFISGIMRQRTVEKIIDNFDWLDIPFLVFRELMKYLQADEYREKFEEKVSQLKPIDIDYEDINPFLGTANG